MSALGDAAPRSGPLDGTPDDATAVAIPRSRIPIGVERRLRGRLASLSAGRTLAIEFFSSRCCWGVWIGDLTARWLDGPPDATLAWLAPIEGVAVAADRRLLDLLAEAGPTLHESGPIFARGLRIELDRPERWLEFLDCPAVRRAR